MSYEQTITELIILNLLVKYDLTSHQIMLFSKAFSMGYCELNTKTLRIVLCRLMLKKHITTYTVGKFRYYHIENQGTEHYHILMGNHLITAMGIDKINRICTTK